MSPTVDALQSGIRRCRLLETEEPAKGCRPENRSARFSPGSASHDCIDALLRLPMPKLGWSEILQAAASREAIAAAAHEIRSAVSVREVPYVFGESRVRARCDVGFVRALRRPVRRCSPTVRARLIVYDRAGESTRDAASLTNLRPAAIFPLRSRPSRRVSSSQRTPRRNTRGPWGGRSIVGPWTNWSSSTCRRPCGSRCASPATPTRPRTWSRKPCAACSASGARYRGEASFRTWLLQIVVNVDRDRRRRVRIAEPDGRRRARQPRRRRRPSWPPPPSCTTNCGRRSTACRQRQREVALLTWGEGLAAADVATVLEITEAKRLHEPASRPPAPRRRARRRFRQPRTHDA